MQLQNYLFHLMFLYRQIFFYRWQLMGGGVRVAIPF